MAILFQRLFCSATFRFDNRVQAVTIIIYKLANDRLLTWHSNIAFTFSYVRAMFTRK